MNKYGIAVVFVSASVAFTVVSAVAKVATLFIK